MNKLLNKKLISFFLSLVLMFNLSSACLAYSHESVDKMIASMLKMSPEDRTSLFTIIKPLLMVDSGIDLLAGMIKNYDPTATDAINKAMGEMFKMVEPETASSLVKMLKIIDETTRRKYLNIYADRSPAEISDVCKQDFDGVLDTLYQRHPGLKQLFAEDNITPAFIANLLKLFVEINDSKPLFKRKPGDPTALAVNYVSPALSEKAANAWSQGEQAISLSDSAGKIAEDINAEFSEEDRTRIIRILTELGLCRPAGTTPPPTVGTISPTSSPAPPDAVLKIIKADPPDWLDAETAEAVSVVRVYLEKGDEILPDKKLDQPIAIEIEVLEPNAMLYLLRRDGLTPVKYNVYEDGNIRAVISETGYYALRLMPKYFDDTTGWGEAFVESLYNRGIINGKAEGKFMPEENIKREEFVKLVVELFGLTDNQATSDFDDVDPAQWFAPYVSSAYKNKIISGIGGNLFGTGNNITRQDIAKIVYTILKSYGIVSGTAGNTPDLNDFNEIDDYAKESVAGIYQLGIISGDDQKNFNPKSFATRQEAAKMIFGMLKAYIHST